MKIVGIACLLIGYAMLYDATSRLFGSKYDGNTIIALLGLKSSGIGDIGSSGISSATSSSGSSSPSNSGNSGLGGILSDIGSALASLASDNTSTGSQNG